jgi:hypothetical protein
MDQLSIAILRAFPLNSEMRINSPFASTSYYPRAWAYADALVDRSLGGVRGTMENKSCVPIYIVQHMVNTTIQGVFTH